MTVHSLTVLYTVLCTCVHEQTVFLCQVHDWYLPQGHSVYGITNPLGSLIHSTVLVLLNELSILSICHGALSNERDVLPDGKYKVKPHCLLKKKSPNNDQVIYYRSEKCELLVPHGCLKCNLCEKVIIDVNYTNLGVLPPLQAKL